MWAPLFLFFPSVPFFIKLKTLALFREGGRVCCNSAKVVDDAWLGVLVGWGADEWGRGRRGENE